MSTVSDRRTADARSGGKIMRTRQTPASSRTPYARPEKLPEREQPPIEDNHGNPNWLSGLIYPAKMIASGAGKLLSFFDPTSDYSSSDSEDSENDDEEDEMVENDTSFKLDGRSDKVLSSSSKSEKKYAIGQLVMQETFSREEGNELIKLIKSRIVDADGNPDESAANMRTTAIMEARKWLQKKRSGSKNKMENELDATNFAMTSQVSRNEGSPIDMAKSYMQNRPAWASPTLNNSEFRSPSPLGALHFKEETPTSTLRNYEMKRSSLSSGSWNIYDEIRRVRSKATEELLAATPLAKTRITSFSPESDPPQQSSMDVLRGAPADSTHDVPQNVLPDASTSLPSRINQDGGDVVQSIGLQESHQDAEVVADLNSNKDDELNDMRIAATGNGSPSNMSSLGAGQDATQNPSPSKEENGTIAGSSQAGSDVHMVDPHPPDDVVNGSQNSSSVEPSQEPSQDPSQPIDKQPSMTITKDSLRGKKPTTRRGKSRAK